MGKIFCVEFQSTFEIPRKIFCLHIERYEFYPIDEALENISISYAASSINVVGRGCHIVKNVQIYRCKRYVYIHEFFSKSYLIKIGLSLHLLTVAFQLIIC